MCESERRQLAVLLAEIGHLGHEFQKFSAQNLHAFAHLNEFGVVGYETACGAEVDDRHRHRAAFSEDVDMAHDVVSKFFLLFGDAVEIDVVEVFGHLADLGIGDLQPEFLFTLREFEPEPPPG